MEMLAAGPWVFARCCVPHRAVLRREQEGDRTVYITHLELAYENGKRGFDNGHYYVLPESWKEAVKDYTDRVRATLVGCEKVVSEAEVEVWVKEHKVGEDNGI